MSLSALDLFTIGIGPSSSHTVGPMRAACQFVRKIESDGLAPRVARLRCDLYGSLAATGKGHATDGAIMLGFLGEEPETVDVEAAPARLAEVRAGKCLRAPWGVDLVFEEKLDAIWAAMQACVKRGCTGEGILPGGLHVKRRAKSIHTQLINSPEAALKDPLTILDWVNLYALAVNEENAAGGDQCLTTRPVRRRHSFCIPRQGYPDDARHRPRHEIQIQGDLARRFSRQCGRMLTAKERESKVNESVIQAFLPVHSFIFFHSTFNIQCPKSSDGVPPQSPCIARAHAFPLDVRG